MVFTGEKVEVKCPECGAKNEVLWFRGYSQVIKISGTTGLSGNKYSGRNEKIQGKCNCGYKFKIDDLD